MVGGVHYRQPGLWVKARRRSTSCRAAAPGWGSARPGTRRSREALGFPFPPLGERFEMLEETLQIAHGMWTGERGSRGGVPGPPRSGRRGCSTRPQSISRPRPPIMIGGGGERKTLRLVAQYADATNVFGGPTAIAHKYEVLRAALRGRRPRPRRDRALDAADVRSSLGERRVARPRSSTGSASSPTPAPST